MSVRTINGKIGYFRENGCSFSYQTNEQLTFNLSISLANLIRNLPANRLKITLAKAPTRKVKDGTLKPIKLLGGDRFCVEDLLAPYLEGQQKGRI
ncbi:MULTISPECIES: hypothetical protein [unclassified Pedobacter]|uniref:hypothetical protein n=1 Tax=unclassified Pedobacter TaxID=2628915 RepID=UPI001DDEA782|nr:MULTISPECIES: hypothetical protein [unclassified Pedobacter]CAH0127337.1 hypothetical protein SRABI36_00181 [Pedobacter sp. Bi36]CAH0181699.1 hypothetical protein SRABI126_01276 [Pedobacter sp. Bi126]